MKTKMFYVMSLLSVLLASTCSASSLFELCPHCIDFYEDDDSGGWIINASADYQSANLESDDRYLSGYANDEDWRAVHDIEGDLYGFSINTRPPVWGRRVALDFSHLTGDLKGDFNTREISPTPEGPYAGTVKYDREDWEFGADIFILNAVYTRLQYATFEMDGDWVYTGGGADEPQKYDFDAYTIGIGWRQDYYLLPEQLPEKRFGVFLNVFGGLSFLNYEHTEKSGGASVETDDIGFEFDAEIMGKYRIGHNDDSCVYAGIGYTYSDSSESRLKLTQKGPTAKLGVRVAF